MQEDSQQFVVFFRLVVLDIQEEGRHKIGLTLSLPFVKKFGKAARVLHQEDTSFGRKSNIGYGLMQGIHPCHLSFKSKDDTFYLSSIQGFALNRLTIKQKNVKTGRFWAIRR